MALWDRLSTEVLPKAVKEGRFGKEKVKFIEYKRDTEFSAQDQFSSSVHFGDVILETSKGDRITESVIVKSQPERLTDYSAESLEAVLRFYNEFLFYTEILPLLRKCDSSGVISDIFPKLFYGSVACADGASDDILIFQNVQKLGFQHAESRAFIDYNHIKLTLEWVGKFHALSLVCKKKFPGKLEELASKIRETYWTEERVVKNWDAFFVANCKRGILPLQNDPNYKDKLKDLSAVVEETDFSMAKIVTPVEPLAVICHGDFCRNNIFYKYDSDGIPYEIIFFDLALVRYSSPVIDLSFFLFMNSSPEVKSSRWNDILTTYHSALTSHVHLPPQDLPSLGDLTTDFKRRGFYGYVHASYFLPIMQREEKTVDEWWKLSPEEHIKLRVSTGGERATGYVVKMAKHMIDENFDFKYIKNLELKPLKKLGE